MTFELKEVKSKFGEWQGEVHVNGTFVCIEYGNTEEELKENFANSQDIYLMLSRDVEQESF